MEAGDPPMKYLLVTTSDEMSVQQYPLGVFERPVTAADLAQFVQRSCRRIGPRTQGSTPSSFTPENRSRQDSKPAPNAKESGC